jgi:hypothetical protein
VWAVVGGDLAVEAGMKVNGQTVSAFTALAALTVVAIAGTAVILSLLWRAWWLYPAWAWHVEPLGMPSVSFWHFAALLLLVDVVTYRVNEKKDNANWFNVAIQFALPMLAWAVLWWLR